MPLFQTIIHPTDFDEPSKEAFRVTRSLARALGARVVVFHVVAPPAVLTQDGRVIRSPQDTTASSRSPSRASAGRLGRCDGFAPTTGVVLWGMDRDPKVEWRSSEAQKIDPKAVPTASVR
jgi:nucleotide-binding universal stress UspA family protein